jgi:phosphoglycolate phosphatase
MAQEKPLKVFFDLDGTLLDTSERNYRVYSKVTEEFGGIPLDKKTYWGLKRKKTKWPELLPLSKLPADIETDFLQKFIPLIEHPDYLRFDVLQPGALDVLRATTAKHECRVVSLRRNEANLRGQLNKLQIAQYFTEILSGHSESDGFDKKLELVGKRIDLEKERGVIVGDTEADIITGQKLGMITIALTSGIRDAQFLENLHPDYIIEHLDDMLMLPPFEGHSPLEGLYL